MYKKLKEPSNIDKLHHLLGLPSYYWKFILLFTDVTKPLNKLLKKGTKCQWSLQGQAAFKHLKQALNKEPILQYLSTEKLYTLFSDTSQYVYSGVLTQAVESPEDLRSVAFTSGSFSERQQRWSANEKEAYSIYHSVLKFDLYLRRAKCVLHCDHNLLEPFLSRGTKTPKLNRWSMEFADCNITFLYTKGKTMHWQTLSPS